MSTELEPKKRLSMGTFSAIIIAIGAIIFSLQNFYLHVRDNVVTQKTISQLQIKVSDLQNSKTIRSQKILSEVYYLVHVANLHLLLDHDPASAVRVLQMAENMLSSSNDSSFSALSQAVSSDITALQAVPTTDINQTFLSLSTLISQVQSLSPIPASPTISVEKTIDAMKSAGKTLSWHDRIFASLKQLKGLFVIRHLDQPNTPIVTADTEALIKQNMIMQLNMSQWALLHRDQKIYVQSLQNVSLWLNQYFALTTEKDAIITQLDSLEKIQIDAALPSINNTLNALSLINKTDMPTEVFTPVSQPVVTEPSQTIQPSVQTTPVPTKSKPKSSPASVET